MYKGVDATTGKHMWEVKDMYQHSKDTLAEADIPGFIKKEVMKAHTDQRFRSIGAKPSATITWVTEESQPRGSNDSSGED
jgi:hypothetical protein